MSSPLRISLLLLSLPLLACATATGDDDDDNGARTLDDAGAGVKEPPPPGSNPDATVIVGFPDAAPLPDGAPGAPDSGCSVTTIDLLENGNFDSGASVAWAQVSSGGLPLILAEGAPEFPDTLQVPADSPTFLAYLAGYPNAVDMLQENITVPEDATGLRLSGVRQIVSSETSTTTAFDVLFFEIVPPGGALVEEMARFSNLDETTGSYVPFDGRANGDYRGRQVTVQIRATTDASLNTHFFFDSLVLEVSTCAGG